MTKFEGVQAHISHFGVCVTDIDRSIRFYRDGLGFTEGITFSEKDRINPLIGIPENLLLRCQFMTLEGVTVELIHFTSPELVSARTPRPMNQSGFTHLALRVSDVDAAAATLEKFGGKTLRETRFTNLREGIVGEILFCTDPDGTRIELLAFPDQFTLS